MQPTYCDGKTLGKNLDSMPRRGQGKNRSIVTVEIQRNAEFA